MSKENVEIVAREEVHMTTHDAALALARLIEAGPDPDEGSRPDCRKCHTWMHTPGDLEPSPLCSICAQDAADVLATALLALAAEKENAREILAVCHEGIDALWKAYHSGAWEMNHHEDVNDVPCPEDDTCECEGREAARLLSKASGLLTSWTRIDALKDFP